MCRVIFTIASADQKGDVEEKQEKMAKLVKEGQEVKEEKNLTGAPTHL
jgi:hypothetical protein